jgi:DNA-binding protein HU-beta
MNKQELINKVVELSELTKKDSTKAVDAVFDAITEALASGDNVKIIGFGNFEVRERAARKGQNPKLLKQLKEQGVDVETAKAQAAIDIASSKAPAFKPAKNLKSQVNG